MAVSLDSGKMGPCSANVDPSAMMLPMECSTVITTVESRWPFGDTCILVQLLSNMTGELTTQGGQCSMQERLSGINETRS